jgi:hypothetical protein
VGFDLRQDVRETTRARLLLKSYGKSLDALRASAVGLISSSDYLLISVANHAIIAVLKNP